MVIIRTVVVIIPILIPVVTFVIGRSAESVKEIVIEDHFSAAAYSDRTIKCQVTQHATISKSLEYLDMVG